MQDWDPTLYSEDGSTKGTSIEQYYDYAILAFKNAGIMIDPGPHLEQWFREAGFVDIQLKSTDCLWGPGQRIHIMYVYTLPECCKCCLHP